MVIDSFRGENYFLSNFYICEFVYDGIKYSSTEAAFQGQKFLDRTEQIKISQMTPREAKNYPRKKKTREDWFDVSLQVMHDVVYAKFSQNPDLKAKLIATGDAELIEGNTWNDVFWGVCNGKGENQLGKTLMKVREELKSENDH